MEGVKMEKIVGYCGFSYKLLLEGGLVKEVRPVGGASAPLSFEDVSELKPDLKPFTDFERRVMEKAMEIPRGRVATYGGLARAVGGARSARAVGNVMARNPMPIVVPCHRVVKSDLTIGEYAHGSVAKEALLMAEGVVFEGRKVRRECLHRFVQ